ncbi:MAG: hypothetical protein ABIX28_04425, partial [Vicinamibacterales bacterium]
AYVGNAARNQLVNRQINGRPYGYAYQAANLDPSNISNGQAQPYLDDLLRPYRGYGSITQREFTGYSDYGSLQFSVNRRRSADGLSLGMSYTYELKNKTLSTIDPFLDDNRARNYTQNGRRKHNLVINYSYEPPKFNGNAVLGRILNDWQLSGITSILSGSRPGFSYSFTGVPTGTLSGTGAISGNAGRVDILCDPNLPRGERTFTRQFKTECIGPPSDTNRLGNAMNDELQGPGYVNFDISLFKNVPVGGNRRLQFRVELYNAFNHDQFTGVNTGAQFDFVTKQLSNPTAFGYLSGATLSARRIQLGARFTF